MTPEYEAFDLITGAILGLISIIIGYLTFRTGREARYIALVLFNYNMINS